MPESDRSTEQFATVNATRFDPLPPACRLETGALVPRGELTQWILSSFWRDWHLHSNRMPAPVIELIGASYAGQGRPLRAWWLSEAGIFPDRAGPAAERLGPFLATTPHRQRRWPCYEFQFYPDELKVEQTFHWGIWSGQGHQFFLLEEPENLYRVTVREPRWVA